MKFLSLLVLTLVAVLCLSAVDISSSEARCHGGKCGVGRSVYKARASASCAGVSRHRARRSASCSGF